MNVQAAGRTRLHGPVSGGSSLAGRTITLYHAEQLRNASEVCLATPCVNGTAYYPFGGAVDSYTFAAVRCIGVVLRGAVRCGGWCGAVFVLLHDVV